MIAGNTLPQLAVVIVARVGIGREPFLEGECIAAGMVKREQAIGAAHRECPPIGRQQNVRARHARRPGDADCGDCDAAPAQRRLQ
jgi:hypothetical protein